MKKIDDNESVGDILFLVKAVEGLHTARRGLNVRTQINKFRGS